MRNTELLIPAGSLDVLKTAVVYGADAVYIGGEAFGLRAKAHNFSLEDMKEGVEFAHSRGVKVYVTANILAHNDDLEGVEQYFEELKSVKPDALIISDPVRHRKACTAGYGAACQHPGQQHQLWNVSVLVSAGSEARGFRQRAVFKRDQRDPCPDSGGYGDRELYAWRYVYFLFRTVSAEQLLYRKRCQSGRLHASMPLEIFHRGGNQTRRVYAGL